jgi:hypothetical protein
VLFSYKSAVLFKEQRRGEILPLLLEAFANERYPFKRLEDKLGLDSRMETAGLGYIPMNEG